MKCTLCENEIRYYSPEFNHLAIDEAHSADICPDCLKKFLAWQQGVYAKLFPTTSLKKRLRRNR